MNKFKVTVSKRSEWNYEATFTCEAASEDEAKKVACQLMENGNIDWELESEDDQDDDVETIEQLPDDAEVEWKQGC
jgi:hypothetical protein